ncbi:MAG: membrane protein insertion efficiency factor YidD [Bacteroidales bacterium]
MRRVLVAPFIGLIYVYKYVISPMLPKGCRHFPSCSSYSIDALKMHGLYRGGLLAADRVARCRPWGTSGYDPVPRFIIKKIQLRRLLPGNRENYPSCDRLKPH